MFSCLIKISPVFGDIDLSQLPGKGKKYILARPDNNEKLPYGSNSSQLYSLSSLNQQERSIASAMMFLLALYL